MAQTSSIKIGVDLEPVREAIAEIVDTITTVSVLAEVGEALESARAKHGKQDHLPLGIGPNESILGDLHRGADYDLHKYSNLGLERLAKALEQFRSPEVAESTWAKIAFEEVAEFMAADSLAEARKEALQAAAMFVAIVTVIDAHAAA